MVLHGEAQKHSFETQNPKIWPKNIQKLLKVPLRFGSLPLTRLLLKAGCAPCLAGCRWYGICTKWVENLLFEVILMAFSSVSRPETWRTLFFPSETLSGGQKRWFLRKMCYLKKGEFFWTFPALQGPGPGPYGPIRVHMGPSGPLWAYMGPKNPKIYVRKYPV